MVPKKVTSRGEIHIQHLEAQRCNPLKGETNFKPSIWGLHCFGFCHQGLSMEILGFTTRWGSALISGIVSLIILTGIFIFLDNTYYKMSTTLFLVIKLECKRNLTLQYCRTLETSQPPLTCHLLPWFISRLEAPWIRDLPWVYWLLCPWHLAQGWILSK